MNSAKHSMRSKESDTKRQFSARRASLLPWQSLAYRLANLLLLFGTEVNLGTKRIESGRKHTKQSLDLCLFGGLERRHTIGTLDITTSTTLE